MSSLNVCCASGGHETIPLLYFTENFRASHHHWVFVSVKRGLFDTIIAQNNKIIITVVIKGLLHWNSWTDVVVETPACEQGPHYTKRQTVPSDNGLSFDPVQFNTDWIKQNIALSFSLKLHSSKYCRGWKEEMRGAAKANKQIEGIICCERLNGTGWPIGLDCWNQRTSSTSTTYKKKYAYRHTTLMEMANIWPISTV